MKARILPGTLLMATAFLAGCSQSPPPPLGGGGNPGTQCMHSARNQPVTTGIYNLRNNSSVNVTIRSLTLPSAHGLKAAHWWLVPFYHDPSTGEVVAVGAGAPYPPVTAPQWPQRQSAQGM